MQLRKITQKFLLVFSLIVVFYGCNENESQKNIVSEVNGYTTVSFSELDNFYKSHLFDRRFPESKIEGYKAALNELLVKKQKEIDFVESGMNTDSLLLKKLARVINEEVIVQYFNEEFLPKYINEESIKQYYESMGRKVTYRQIVIRKPRNANRQELSALRNRTNQIRDELVRSRNSDDVAKIVSKYSQHQESALNAGYMPPITWERSAESPLIQVIFNMQEGTIQTLENPNAFYIIFIEDVSSVEVPPLDEVRDDVVKNMRELYLDKSLEEFSYMKENAVDVNSFEWNEEALDKLTAWAKKSRFYEIHYEETFNEAIKNGDNFLILTYSDGKLDLKEYLRLINEVLVPGKASYLSKNDLKSFIEEAIKTDIVVKMAKDLGKGEDLLTLNTPSDAIKNQFELLYTQQRIYAQLPEPTPQALQEFYEAEKNSTLYQLAKVNIHAKIFESKEEAEDLWLQIENGKTFEEATNRRYKVKTFIKTRDGEIQSHRSKEPPYLGEDAFLLEEGEVGGPIEFKDDNGKTQFAVIKSAVKKEEKVPNYSEISDIEKKFMSYHRERLSKIMREDLRNKYPVTVYEDVLEQRLASVD